MTDKQLTKFILEKKRLPLSIDDYLNFIFLLLPPAFTAIGVSMIYARYKFDDTICLLIGGVFVIVLSLLFMRLSIIRIKQNITFSIIHNSNQMDINQIAALINDHFKIYNLKIDKKLNRILVHTKMSAFSWGEVITIIIDGSNLLVNSRPKSSSRAPYNITKDVNNIKKLRNLIQG